MISSSIARYCLHIWRTESHKTAFSNIDSGPEQTSRFGLEVDKKLRVKGAPQGSVWALGDCAVSGCAPTAQVAAQQGKYLGSLFRDTKMDKEAIAAHPDFQFVNKGSLAYLGDGKGQHSTSAFQELVTFNSKRMPVLLSFPILLVPLFYFSSSFYFSSFSLLPFSSSSALSLLILSIGVAEIRGLWDHHPADVG
jgi:NADH dehydrogenase FAD-containing subunit